MHFTTARELFEKLRPSTSADVQFRRLTANRARLLIIDEIGCEPLDHLAATHFFRLICERYERGSIVLTSNKRFSESGERLIGDETLAAAILDRLLHHATSGNYRLKETARRNPGSKYLKGQLLSLPTCQAEWRTSRRRESGGSPTGVDIERGVARAGTVARGKSSDGRPVSTDVAGMIPAPRPKARAALRRARGSAPLRPGG